MNVLRAVSLGFCLAVVLPSNAMAQGTLIPPNSKVFLQHIDGFGTDLLAALIGANVPVVIVTDRMDADLEIGGRKQQRNRSASYASDLIDEATITITDIHTATVIDAFTLTAATRDKLARACANRLNDRIAIPKPTQRFNPPPHLQRLIRSASSYRATSIVWRTSLKHCAPTCTPWGCPFESCNAERSTTTTSSSP